jgi:hypothetical protein
MNSPPFVRSRIDISFNPDSKIVAEQMAGFHWITVYGDYLSVGDPESVG